MLAFDSNLAPIVGQQITLTNTNAAVVSSHGSKTVVTRTSGGSVAATPGASAHGAHQPVVTRASGGEGEDD